MIPSEPTAPDVKPQERGAVRALQGLWAAYYRGWVPWAFVAAHMALIFFLSSRTPDELDGWNVWELPDGLMHAIAYGALGLLLFGALRRSGQSPWGSALWSLLLAVLYGITDEVHQAFVPGRTPDVKDLWWDAVGAGLTVAAAAAWVSRRLRRRGA